MNRRLFLVMFAGLLWMTGWSISQPADDPQTFCNPLNLNYRFMIDARDGREAADPVVILFKDDYYLFASRSGGYWVSGNFRDWTLVIPNKEMPIDVYAPAVFVIGDSLYYVGSQDLRLFVTADPKGGQWTKTANIQSYGDPALFLDDDGRVYMYYGLSNTAPTGGVELDPNGNFKEIGSRVNIVYANAAEHGWERRGDDNLLDEKPWIEGSWMIKNNGAYYLHYAGPGTEFKTYADGIYTSDAPLGPFTYAEYSPFSFKPTGFIAGAGHGCTFRDKAGNWWRIVTMTISVKHMFERRLGLFPVGFDGDGQIRCNTEFADYPQYLPGVKTDPVRDNFTGWMLLSRYKQARASSIIEDHGVGYAVDEDVRTYWSAATGDSGEWLVMDLGKACNIHAIQVNFAESGTNPRKVRGREVVLYQQYFIETSLDSLAWTLLVDKSANMKDVPHDYIELAQPAQARYVRIVNVFSPGEGMFALRDLRIFGNPGEANRTIAASMNQVRNPPNSRDATIVWDPVPGADGYIVRYGIHPFKLYNNYMVYDTNSVDVHSLNKDVIYVFEVESFDSGTEYYRGSYTSVGERRGAASPEGFGLGQNYPNPFNPRTRIPYELKGVQDVHLDVFSLNGRRVFTYSEDAKPAGSHEILLSSGDLPNGIYIYRLQAGEFAKQRKMVVIK